jgi:hypothetical protein
LLLLLLSLSPVCDNASPCVVGAPHIPPEALQLQDLAVVNKQVHVITIRLDIPANKKGTKFYSEVLGR